ncbi:MAG: ERCC4 domain-containing protein [Phycisphaerales bacterium]|nr:ERCC4 domain-containing protein [Phycisphaerales bacterium]
MAAGRPHTEPEPVVVIDTREQRPYAFPRSVVRTLSSGDYSIEGYETVVAIERKSKEDAYGTIGGGRERFHREVERLAGYDYAAIVVESSLPAFLKPPPYSQLHPNAAIGTLLSWSVRYRLPVLFAGDREHAQAATHHLLKRFAWYAQEGTLVR